MPDHLVLLFSAGLSVVLNAEMASNSDLPQSADVWRALRTPDPRYSTSPLWVWNDRMTEANVRQGLRDLAAQNVRQAFVHPRPGLKTPYLSEAWFDLWKVALDEAGRLDMLLWMYDENSYPSGFAGGFVPEAMPESRGQGLDFVPHDTPPTLNEETVAVFRLTEGGYADLTAQAREGGDLPDGAYLVAVRRLAPPQPWHGGYWYVDLLQPGVVEKFLDVTLEAYHREIGDAFGQRVPGIFTDEPELMPARAFPWNDHLPARFEQRWGYSLTDHLPALSRDIGDYKRIRHNYLQLLNELFIDHWARPYHDACEKYGLEFTGHYWEHDWPFCLRVPDNMAMYAWHQRPAIDNLMNRYGEHLHAQFGNTRTVRELASVANQMGRSRTLCEAFGAGGWDLRLEDMKRIGEWLYVLGVNTLDEHLSYTTIAGARKRDHPQSFSAHAPWWDAYHNVADHFTRLSAALSHGQQVNHILLLEPTTTAWMYNNAYHVSHPRLLELGHSFEKLIRDLEAAQVEYDLGSEDIIARHGSVGRASGDQDTPTFVVNRRAYTTVVLSPMTENLNASTCDLLEAYVSAGGRVMAACDPPSRVEGQASTRIQELAGSEHWQRVAVEELPERLDALAHDDFRVSWRAADGGQLYHQRRRLADGQLLFLVNSSLESQATGTVKARAAAVREWDMAGLTEKDYPADHAEDRLSFRFSLPPAGSRLFMLYDQAPEKQAPRSMPEPKDVTSLAPAGDVIIERTQPNVLTLDYVDLTAGGETHEGLDVIRAGHRVFAAHGLERNPWDRAVQFRDRLITRTFPDESGFEATYRFTIRDRVPRDLAVVIERADLYTITCNGQPIATETGQWWLDRHFYRLAISEAAQVGENTLTLTAQPLNIEHELEAVYVLGDFRLMPLEKGFAIAPPVLLEVGPWNVQGLPLYGHGVAYTLPFDVPDPGERRYAIRLPDWHGSVARVFREGEHVGDIWHQPWRLDVTSAIRPGRNAFTIEVIGTLKNTLGPHHGDPVLGAAWPGMWDQYPETGPPAGDAYHTVAYGLFQRPELVSWSGGR